MHEYTIADNIERMKELVDMIDVIPLPWNRMWFDFHANKGNLKLLTGNP